MMRLLIDVREGLITTRSRPINPFPSTLESGHRLVPRCLEGEDNVNRALDMGSIDLGHGQIEVNQTSNPER